MEIKKTTMKSNSDLCGVDFKMEVENDIIVPDVKPDVIKVICVNARMAIKEKYTQNERITISGVINYKILYQGDSEKFNVHTIDYSSPFSQSFDLDCANNSESVVIPTLLNTINNVQNSRKINVKAQYGINIQSNNSSETDIITNLNENEFLPFKSEKTDITNKTVSQNDVIEIADSIDISENISEILYNTCFVDKKDIKVVNNKIIVKGELTINIVYLTNDDTISTYTYKEEFSEVLDVLGITPESNYKIGFSVQECDLKLVSGSDVSTITLSNTIDVFTDVYDTISIMGIYDIYSPDYIINPTYEKIEYLTHIKSDSKINTFVDTIEAKSDNIDKILCIDKNAIIKNKYFSEGKVFVQLIVCLNIIYLSDEKVFSIKKEVPAEFFFDIDYDDVKILPNIVLNDTNYSVNANKIEVKIPLKCDIMVFTQNSKNLLVDLEFDEKNKIDKTNKPSVVVYIVKEGDTLWKIAKKYNTTVEEIMSLNNLTSDEISPGNRLIIAKRKWENTKTLVFYKGLIFFVIKSRGYYSSSIFDKFILDSGFLSAAFFKSSFLTCV